MTFLSALAIVILAVVSFSIADYFEGLSERNGGREEL
jgi:hypothetical protein